MVKFYGVDLSRPAARGRARAARTTPAGSSASGCVWLAPAACCSGCSGQRRSRCSSSSPLLLGLRRRRRTLAAAGWLLVPVGGAPGVSYEPARVPRRDRGRRRAHRSSRCAASITAACARAAPWDCGFSAADAAHAGHGGRLRPADPAHLRAVLPHPPRAAVAVRSAPRYHVVVEDRFWQRAVRADRAARRAPGAAVAWLQQGRISVYLLYSFLTLLVLLVFVR